MVVTDFKKHNITEFTVEEVIKTGAKLKDVPIELMIELNTLALLLPKGVKVHLLRNGLTSGEHVKDSFHPKGKAADVYIAYDNLNRIISLALNRTKFRGFGFYRNTQGVVSIHFDMRSKFRTWTAIQKKNVAEKSYWKYTYYPEQHL